MSDEPRTHDIDEMTDDNEFGSDAVVRKKETGVEAALKNASERIDDISSSFAASIFSVFYPAYYDDVDVPEENIRYDENGKQYAIPEMVKPWKCHYYYQSERKARLARHSAYAGVIIFLSLVPMFAGVPGGIGAFILGVLLLINFQFRYRDIALWKWPMPEIPFLSQLDIGENIREANEKSQKALRDKEEYERMVEESSVEFIEPVDNYRDDYPSPATILTNWMNASAHMTKEDFIDESDGKINNFTMNLLLDDNKGAWEDESVLDVVSQITKTRASDWIDAYNNWESA